MGFDFKRKKQECIKELIDYFENERDEEIGMIAAENILDQVLQNVAVHLYNKGVNDSISLLNGQLENLQFDMESLIKLQQ